MAVTTKTWACNENKTIRINSKTGQSDSDWLMSGRDTHGNIHRILLDFIENWDGVGIILKAELAITSSSEHNFSFGSGPKVRVAHQTKAEWSEGNAGDGSWHTDEYTSTGGTSVTPVAGIALGTTKEHTSYIDVTAYAERIAPKSVFKHDGVTKGEALTQRGVFVWSPDEGNASQRIEFHSRRSDTVAKRPSIRLTYDVGTVKPSPPTLVGPSGDTNPNESFTGTFASLQDADVLSKTEVRLWNSTATTMLWSRVFSASEAEMLSATFSIPFPVEVKALKDYKWDARCADQAGTWSDFAAKMAFRVSNTVPVVSVTPPVGAVSTLRNYLFTAGYSDPDGDALKFFRMQLRTQTSESNPAWETDLLWDSGLLAPRLSGDGTPQIETEYGGKPLAAGWYSYRIKAEDARGAESVWDYADIQLANDYVGDGSGFDFMTTYSRKDSRYRVVLREVNTAAGRGPKNPPVGIITDAANIGAATYANSPGEFFMTLPIDHPQASVCEPYRTHYAVEQYVGDQWVERFTGLLDDFDATDDEIVFHGIDYLGLLTMSVDERYDPLAPDKAWTAGGSKYTDQLISLVIADLIDTGRIQQDSTYNFITRGSGIAGLWDTLAEHISITTTYNQHLSMISGLLASHRQGTGRRTRLYVEKSGGAYRFRLKENYGKDRPNITLTYGGLINGFRIIGFGDFGTIAHGIGRIKDQLKPYYSKYESPTNDGVHTATGVWGRVSKAAVWQDLQDQNDLNRRVQELAMTSGKIGKRAALAIAVGAIAPFDGYDIFDSVPLSIKRGNIDTSRYGSGMWTIHGVAWQMFPDGHTNVTLTVLPKEDGSPVDPDLLAPSMPILPDLDWQVGFDPPEYERGKTIRSLDTGLFMDAGYSLDELSNEYSRMYFDAASGRVYGWSSDGTWDLVMARPTVVRPTNVLASARATVNPSGVTVTNLSVKVAQ